MTCTDSLVHKDYQLDLPTSIVTFCVSKGFTQIKNVHYFESFALVASFVTLRLVFALTALPHFQVNHYDVSVAFIESELDDSTPPR